MTKDIHYAETRYGFEYGAAKVGRITSYNGTVLIGIGSVLKDRFDYQIQVSVSPQGRSIRVFRKGKELK